MSEICVSALMGLKFWNRWRQLTILFLMLNIIWISCMLWFLVWWVLSYFFVQLVTSVSAFLSFIKQVEVVKAPLCLYIMPFFFPITFNYSTLLQDGRLDSLEVKQVKQLMFLFLSMCNHIESLGVVECWMFCLCALLL